jgi:L-aminopeptidase/D-esterase-like protein
LRVRGPADALREAVSPPAVARPKGRELTLTDVPGLSVGVAEDPERNTGVTAVLLDRWSPVSVEVRGPASGSYDIASLGLEATFGRRDALFFSGGSVYGLDAARGVRTRLLEVGRGEPAFGGGFPLPRVSGAVLFDLPRRPAPIPDYLALGYGAAASAGRAPVPVGRAGAGRGARIGKYRGPGASEPGGQASAAVRVPGGSLGVLVVFNSVGGLYDPRRGRWLAAGASRGTELPPDWGTSPTAKGPGPGTTLALVATDLPLDRRTLFRLCQHAHDGIARVVVPAHTATEGDVVFAVSTREGGRPMRAERRPGERSDQLGTAVERLIAEAARRLVRRSDR